MSARQMQPSTLARLGALRPYPAVSVLAPTHRHEPGNRADPIVERDLADEAARRVRGELEHGAARRSCNAFARRSPPWTGRTRPPVSRFSSRPESPMCWSSRSR